MITDTELFNAASALKPGDVVRFEVKMKHPRDCGTHTARISSVEVHSEVPSVSITYVPCRRPDSVQCGFGCHHFRSVPTGANSAGHWGWQSIEVVGREQPPQFRSDAISLYRNPGYDLVNM